MSLQRDTFEAEVKKPQPDWETAVDNLSSLAMSEMLLALAGLDSATRTTVVDQARKILSAKRGWTGAYERIKFAADVVGNHKLPPIPSGLDARQIEDARNFLLKDPTAILVVQKNPTTLTAAHNVSKPVVRPAVTVTPLASFRFTQFESDAEIHDLLFEVRKAGSVFWVGAAVPKGTTDFTRAQIYFHPTVVQVTPKKVIIHADDKDYREFTGGWSASLRRYVAMQGVQLAKAGRLMPLLVPFTTMAALRGSKARPIPAQNMFGDRPVDTLNAVMEAIQSEIAPKTAGTPSLAKLGASSFSSGIGALRLFLASMSSSGLVKEVIDFDSPFITIEPKRLTPSLGAVSKCFTQTAPSGPSPPGYVTVAEVHFAGVTAYRDNGLHGRIGWMMYYQAMLHSVIS